MPKRTLLVVLLLACLPACQCPRWVDGAVRVVDAETGHPVAGAVVATQPSRFFLAWGSCIDPAIGTTNADGVSSIRLPKKGRKIVVEAVGYNQWVLLVLDDVPVVPGTTLEIAVSPVTSSYRVLQLEARDVGTLEWDSHAGPPVFVRDQDGHVLPYFLPELARTSDRRGVFRVYSDAWVDDCYRLIVASKAELARAGAEYTGRWHIERADLPHFEKRLPPLRVKVLHTGQARTQEADELP